ncbi:MAG: bacillithiol biosynthesis deacetylase BshB1 [Acidobacteriota bacterium]|nr:bacillithiol biosynthesis deacetylase BshB1 [Acidobacteriota bacterium]MDH3522087.1 bacillithiol biosynthesis deacetylase BshB1 [Acidobacteriota bacterium]
METETLAALAIGAHPDDVELGCGGTLALLAAAGRRVGILHLTRGEAGTRGTPDEREAEAHAAAAALGAVAVDFLNCGDGRLRTGEDEEDAVIAVLRRWRPEIVFGPAPRDRHPDHGRAHRLVAAAAFYAGLARRGRGQPYRPAAVFSYLQHDPFEPRFVVDVSAAWERKLAALAAYGSQLHQPGRAPALPPTKVASPEFRAAVEGRARHFGLLIGAEYGEPFWSPLPLAVRDPLELAPGGLR